MSKRVDALNKAIDKLVSGNITDPDEDRKRWLKVQKLTDERIELEIKEGGYTFGHTGR